MGVVYGTSNLLLKSAFGAFGDLKVLGKENVPKKGALIVVANHLSDVDPALLNVCIPRKVRYMAKAEFFEKPVVSRFFKAYGAFPINENGREVHAIKRSLDLFDHNEAMGIFPEGAKNPSVGRAMLGTAMIAIISGAPILPVGITGTERISNWRKMCYPRGRFRINIGKPFTIPDTDGTRLRESVKPITDIIMRNIAELLPENYRGEYDEDWDGERAYTSPPDWWIRHPERKR